MSADQYREALEEILKLVEPGDGAPIGSRGDGTIGRLWFDGEQEAAFKEIARITRHALGVTE